MVTLVQKDELLPQLPELCNPSFPIPLFVVMQRHVRMFAT
jgi:hypothetical protein